MTALPGSEQVGERVRLMRDGLLQNVPSVVSGVVGILLVPMFLHRLGEQAYGLWLSAIGVATLVSAFDLGLRMSITREVAARNSAGQRFVRSAGNLCILVGLAGAATIIVSGLVLRRRLELDALAFRQAPWIFAMVGAGFLGEFISAYAISVLAGARRFGTVSLLVAGELMARAIGFFLLLWLRRGGLPVLVGWQAMISWTFALIALVAVARRAPGYALRLGQFEWPVVRERIRFALSNQVAGGASAAVWRMPPLIVGALCGAAFVTPFWVAQRFPLMLEFLLWRAADVFLPAVAERAHDRLAVTELLEAGTRFSLLLAAPVSVVLWVLAPMLLGAWLGSAASETVWVVRLASAAVLFECLGHAAEQILWGLGRARTLVSISLARVALIGLLCACLIPRFEIIGAALAILAGIVVGSVFCLRAAVSNCSVSASTLMMRAAGSLIVPVAVSAAAAWAVARAVPTGGWLGVAAGATAASAAYVGLLFLGFARPEERALARELLSLPRALARLAWRRPNARENIHS